jgi:hypothetical protein
MSHRNAPAVLAALDLEQAQPWTFDRLTTGLRRMVLMFSLYFAIPVLWYAGIAADVSRGLWNWVMLDVLLVVPGVLRGLVALLG